MPEEGTNVATLMPKPRYRPSTPSVEMMWRAMWTPFVRGSAAADVSVASPRPLTEAAPMLPACSPCTPQPMLVMRCDLIRRCRLPGHLHEGASRGTVKHN